MDEFTAFKKLNYFYLPLEGLTVVDKEEEEKKKKKEGNKIFKKHTVTWEVS